MGPGTVDAMYASGVLQWWSLRTAADQAIHSHHMHHPGFVALGPELSVATNGMSPRNRHGDEITSVLKEGSRFTDIYTVVP